MKSESSFFSNISNSELENNPFFRSVEEWANSQCTTVYMLDAPLGNEVYSYEYANAFFVLIPRKKLLCVNFGEKDDVLFDEYYDDVLDDLSFISDKFGYKDILGRRKRWEPVLCEKINISEINNFSEVLERLNLEDGSDRRKADILISLFTGSINDANKVGKINPESNLDKVKQKIVLFDGDQSRFIYEKLSEQKVIRIQGLSGTGKTELLLHKIKNLYVQNDSGKILLTCHNKILAHDLAIRIPKFFDYMKVDKQISPDRLVCMHSWGSSNEMGTYRYLCQYYGLPFFSLRSGKNFDNICAYAVELLERKLNFHRDLPPPFDWIFIDECQDFGEGFIKLCSFAAKNRVYAAGDIFQSIFDDFSHNQVIPDCLLCKCYRTDPKTLMFAHGLGMGLFERERLKWLENDQWENCGYNVFYNSPEKKVVLTRDPLRRFDDLVEDFQSVELVVTEASGQESLMRIVQKIKELKEKNPSIEPDDVCVIFLDDSNDIYYQAVYLDAMIAREIGWQSNRTYETKVKIDGKIQISNKNNVKGLEFPFVICYTKTLSQNLKYRNALYTMMTRSFLQTTLFVEYMSPEIYRTLSIHLNEILTDGKMSIIEPSEAEKKQILMNIANQKKNLSLRDFFTSICDEFSIPKKARAKLFKGIKDLVEGDSFEEEKVKKAILINYDLSKGKN